MPSAPISLYKESKIFEKQQILRKQPFRKTVVFYNRPHLIDEHEQIYEAIKARDGQKAELLMKKHLQADLDFCLHLISN